VRVRHRVRGTLHFTGSIEVRMNIQAIDVLAHFSNVLMLVAYSVRDILWLRWFAVASALTIIPYYSAQGEILWPPIFWATVFTIINLYQIARIYAERRPVVLSADEQKLYDLGFQSLRPREFVSLLLAGEWRGAAAGDEVLTEGENVTAISIATEGTIQVLRQGTVLGTMEPGRIIGTALALTGQPSPISASFVEPGRYMRWPVPDLRAFIDKKPELRTTLQQLVNRDLARKLEVVLSGTR
jgi:hypothetical protein